MATLDDALRVAVAAHTGQKDRNGAPYILHPLRMMLRQHTDTERIVAVLHDVIEDSDWTLTDLRREGFSEEIIAAVDSVTRRENETYTAFVARTKQNPLGSRIKLADLEDNMDLRRIDKLEEKDFERLAKYHLAWLELNAASEG